MAKPWLLYLHGVAYSGEREWLESLELSGSRYGFEAVDPARVIAPEYRDLLKRSEDTTGPVPDTWKRPSAAELQAAELARLDAAALVEQILTTVAPPISSVLSHLPAVEPPPFSPLAEARNYAASPEIQAAVQRRILGALEPLPHGAELVIVGHSLGSVIAARLLKKLRDDLLVRLFVTIGSPLSAVKSLQTPDLAKFPTDRVRAWVNFFDPRDPVTGGHGISSRYPEALDVPIVLPNAQLGAVTHEHGAAYYCAHEKVARLVLTHLLGRELGVPEQHAAAEPHGTEFLFLKSLYLRELAKRLEPASDLAKSVDRARHQLVTAYVTAVAALNHNDGVAARPYPTELLKHPERFIAGCWEGQSLYALAISLATEPIASPWEISEKPKGTARRDALIATLSLIRTEQSSVTDVDIADAVLDESKSQAARFTPERSWIGISVAVAGVVTLAATGIGLAVAAPAGLAGAALVTSTLAAFGPGGMIGGMTTLTALASAGTALATAGAGAAATSRQAARQQLLDNALLESLSRYDPGELRALATSMLTLVGVSERLAAASQRNSLYASFTTAEAQLRARLLLHEKIDTKGPKSGPSKTLREMLEVIDKALMWLGGSADARSAEARAWFAITSGYAAAFAGTAEFYELPSSYPALTEASISTKEIDSIEPG